MTNEQIKEALIYLAQEIDQNRPFEKRFRLGMEDFTENQVKRILESNQ